MKQATGSMEELEWVSNHQLLMFYKVRRESSDCRAQ